MTDKKNPSNSGTQGGLKFTVDAEKSRTQMPSITKLLDRKKIEHGASSQVVQTPSGETSVLEVSLVAESPTPTPSLSISLESPTLETEETPPPAEISISLEPSAPLASPPVAEATTVLAPPPFKGTRSVALTSTPGSSASPLPTPPADATRVTQVPPYPPKKSLSRAFEVRKAQLRGAPASLQLWDAPQLADHSEAAARALTPLFGKGALAAIYFRKQDAPRGMKPPHFCATAAVEAKELAGTWKGMGWNLAVLNSIWPDFWANLSKTGILEIAPGGRYQRLRKILGARDQDWITLIQARGDTFATQGFLLVLSLSSLKSLAPDTQALLSKARPGASPSGAQAA